MAAGYIMPQSNFTATTDPTVNDDVTLGYSEGSPWINTATGFIFVLVDPSQEAADWQQIYPISLRVTTITAAITLTSSHTVVLCDASAGALPVTFPAAASHLGRLYCIVKIESSENPVTVQTSDGEVIAELTLEDEVVPFTSDGVTWRISF